MMAVGMHKSIAHVANMMLNAFCFKNNDSSVTGTTELHKHKMDLKKSVGKPN